MNDWLTALFLGVIEGLTEFIPVSSTGHLLLIGHFLGFESTGKTFEIVIQLGALLAIVTVYFQRLWALATRWPFDPAARRFLLGLLVAFLPAAAIGYVAYPFIKQVLFETPAVICVALILGGGVLLWIDRMELRVHHTDASLMGWRTCLLVGLFQCLAMVPGVSRSGATVVGAMLLGVQKRAAAEFSFFLALPTMGAAVAWDLIQNRDILDFSDLGLIAVGFLAAFLTALIVVRAVLDFVTRHGFAPFAWWRVGIGVAGLAGLWATGGF